MLSCPLYLLFLFFFSLSVFTLLLTFLVFLFICIYSLLILFTNFLCHFIPFCKLWFFWLRWVEERYLGKEREVSGEKGGRLFLFLLIAKRVDIINCKTAHYFPAGIKGKEKGKFGMFYISL